MSNKEIVKTYEPYPNKDLGATYTKEKTTFRLWSPAATSIQLYLYDKGYKSKAYDKIEMKEDQRGTWVAVVEEDMHGVYYTYEIQFEDESFELVDPYAKAVGVNGERGMVVDFKQANPVDWKFETKPSLQKFTDAIIYQSHLRDLTIHRSSGVVKPGTFLGLAERKTRSKEGLATGLDHLIELGVTHLHLLPVNDFSGINEAKLEKAQYNWGFQPQNYQAIEGSYSSNPIDGETRILEFKELVHALHEANLRLILEISFTFKGDLSKSNLHKSMPDYYYTTIDGRKKLHVLNVKQPMAQKYIVDTLVHFAKEYQVDGFCIDHFGFLDQATINLIRSELDKIDPSILLYGETLTENTSLYPKQRLNRHDMEDCPRVALLNHDLNEAVKGPFDHEKQPGFVNGGVEMEASIKFSLAGAVETEGIDYEKVYYSKRPWATHPHQTINYLTRHNDFTLFDKILETSEGLDEETQIKMVKMAGALLLTAQGIPLIHAGDEFLRTKKGDKTSGDSPDAINQLVWDNKYDYEDVFHYFQGLIKLRKDHPAFRMVTKEQINGHLRFLESPLSNTLGVHLKENANGDMHTDILVLFNANTSEVRFKLPHFGVWKVLVDDKKAGTEVIRSFTDETVVLPELTTMVLYSNEKMVKQVRVVEQEKKDTKKLLAIGAVGLYLLLRRKRRK